MRDFDAFRKSAVSYWERRRIIYNIAISLPAIVAYKMESTENWVCDEHRTNYSYIIPVFVASAIGANICYSFCYALEFILGRAEPTSSWLRSGRTTSFVCGVLFAMFLAMIYGGRIADLEWNQPPQ